MEALSNVFNTTSFRIISEAGRARYNDGGTYGEIQHANADSIRADIQRTGDFSLADKLKDQRDHAFDVHERGDADRLYGKGALNHAERIGDMIEKSTEDSSVVNRAVTNREFDNAVNAINQRFDRAIVQTNDSFEHIKRTLKM